MTLQVLNDELVGWLTAEFQRRNEPNFAWKSAVSSLLALPALRAAWPMSLVDYQNPHCLDASGGGYDLTTNAAAGTLRFGLGGLYSYAQMFAGNSQYMSRADGGAGNWADITGTESYIDSSPDRRGLTIGGWFQVLTDTGVSMLLMGKLTGGGVLRSYSLSWITGTMFPQFTIASGAVDTMVTGTVAAATGTWHFFCGRYTPSTGIRVYLNDNFDDNLVGIPASINDTAAPFTIGATGTPSNFFAGYASLCFLCAAALSDAIITAFYQQTRALFGV